MPSLTAAGSVSSLLASQHALAKHFLALATVEGKQAGLRLLSILGLSLLAAGLPITGWLGLLAGVVLALLENNIVSWGVALGTAALLSFASAGMLTRIVVGYRVRGRRQTKDQLEPGCPSAWTQVLGSVQVLTPRWIALHFVSRLQAAAAPTSGPQPDGGGRAAAGERHGS